MEGLRIACPNCQAQYRVRAENLGKRARCSKCGEFFVVDTAGSARDTQAERAVSGLVPCPYCGFQDSGNFCSNCGGRLIGQPAFDFDRCRIGAAYLSQFPAELSYDLGAPPAQRERERQRYDIRQACERFNEQIEEMARVIRYEGPQGAGWPFSRLNVGRLVDSLPPDVPERQLIVEELWTIVSDVEHASAAAAIKEAASEVQEALDGRDAKKAEKALNQLGTLCADRSDAAHAGMLSEFKSALDRLLAAGTAEKQSAAFRKLLDKADKLVFQQDNKKAIKAYQECLFWLSRNELLGKDNARMDVEQKLRALQGDSQA